MVSRFRRSLSFTSQTQTPVAVAPPANADEKTQQHHVRSASLPTRSHPLISQLGQEVRSLRVWRLSSSYTSASPDHHLSWLTSGFVRIEQLLHVTLDDLLHLQQTQDSLRRHRKSKWVDSLLDDFLHFVDAYGCFRDALVSLHQIQSAAQSAVRRRDENKLGSNVRSQRKVEKEILKLVSTLRDMGRIQEPLVLSNFSEAELAGVTREVKIGIASASASVFAGLVSLSSECSSSSFSSSNSSSSSSSSSTSSSSSSTGSSTWSALKKKLTVGTSTSKKTEEEWEMWLEGLKRLEACVNGLESGSEKVFKCLINTRVALLNILTP